jgi:glycosyltransferase 2 family protein
MGPVPDAVRRRGGLALRVLVSALLLGLVLAYADVGNVVDALRDGDWSWFVAAVVLMSLVAVVGGIRWQLLLRDAEVDVSSVRAVRAVAASLFLNNVLPTSFGGDATRAWLVGRESGRLLRATAATVVDKATSLGCLFLLAWLAVAVDRGEVPGSLVRVLFWVTIGLGAATLLAALTAAGVRPVVRHLPHRLAEMLRETWVTLRIWARSGRLAGWLLVLGLVYQALAVLALVAVGKTVAVDLSFALAAVTAAIVVVAMLVPVSIGGLGVREGGFVLLLGEAGISGADATVVSLLSAATILISSAAVVGLTAAYDVRVRGTKAQPAPRQPSA